MTGGMCDRGGMHDRRGACMTGGGACVTGGGCMARTPPPLLTESQTGVKT